MLSNYGVWMCGPDVGRLWCPLNHTGTRRMRCKRDIGSDGEAGRRLRNGVPEDAFFVHAAVYLLLLSAASRVWFNFLEAST